MCMLLMYYDTYYDDDIVPSQYNEVQGTLLDLDIPSLLYGNSHSPGLVDDNYTYLDSAYVLVPNYKFHEHSAGYLNECFDEFEFINETQHAQHFYTFDCLTMGRSAHRVVCECGDMLVESHIVKSSEVVTSGIHRYANCKKCGQLVDLNTDLVITYSNFINNKNVLIYDIIEIHPFDFKEPNTNELYKFDYDDKLISAFYNDCSLVLDK